MAAKKPISKKVSASREATTTARVSKTAKASTIASSKKASTKSAKSESKISSNTPNPVGKLKNLKFDKRVTLPLLAIIILLIFLFLANKYLVVAWVDSKPITWFAYYNDVDKKYRTETVEGLILQKLVESEASKQGITVSDDEVRTQITQIETQQGGAAQLDQILTMQNLNRDDLFGLVKLQIMRQKLFSGGAPVTEEEINAYLKTNEASLPELKPNDASGQAQLRENVRQQLMNERVSATFSAWMEQNINSPRVVRVKP